MVPRSHASTRRGSSPASRPKVFSACTTLSKLSKVPVKARSRACCHTSIRFFPWMISGLVFIFLAFQLPVRVAVGLACRSVHAICIVGLPCYAQGQRYVTGRMVYDEHQFP